MARRQPYQWNAAAARFRDPETGRYISRAQVRQWIDRNIAASQARIQTLSEELRTGAIDLGEWERGMREEVKRTQLASEMLLRGGRNQMTQADFGRVGQRVRAQYDYLAAFVDDLRSGSVRTDGGFLARAKMYAAASRSAFHESERDQLAGLGYTKERSVLHPAEHCALCVSEAARGYVPIGELIPIGERTCLGNDKCSIVYS